METNCKDKLKFTPIEKISAAIPFNLSILIGAYGLYLTNWRLTAAYLGFAYIGVLIMMRYAMCPRCPHLLEGDDCLNMPAPIVKKLISKNRSGPLNFSEKLLIRTIKYGLLLIPIYWLTHHIYLLIPFILFYLIGQISFTFYFCKNCENSACLYSNGFCI